ncbi:hypothetical protein GF325_02700 [Candidatus Bathyarchaeota archaeon]|nr:hypothetical protein [Candidatus Bathyarchaeota archaeon]
MGSLYHHRSFASQFVGIDGMSIDKDIIKRVEKIFTNACPYLEMSQDRNSKARAALSWELACRLEDELGIELKASYFGTKLPHPFMVAPGKHTRPGTGSSRLSLIEARMKEGWAGAILKTVVGNDGTGSKASSKNQGDAYWPVLKHAGGMQFISGERGMKLDLEACMSEFIGPCLEIASEYGFPVVPSLICGFPLEKYEKEWLHSMKQLAKISNMVEADISPTASRSPLSCNTRQEVMAAMEALHDDAIALHQLGMNIHEIDVLSVKLSGQHRQVFPWIVHDMLEQQEIIDFTLFNRELGTLVVPGTIAPVKSAVGGEAIYYHGIHALNSLFEEKSCRKRVRVSYCGGITSGYKAWQVFSLSPVTSIQVASYLMMVGSFNALSHVLGGFAVVMHWMAQKLEKECGIDAWSIDKISCVAHANSIDRTNCFSWLQGPRLVVAEVDPDACTATCKVPAPSDSNVECPASTTCPARAFLPKAGKSSMEIQGDKCIGCGNCSETCMKDAIRFHKTENHS